MYFHNDKCLCDLPLQLTFKLKFIQGGSIQMMKTMALMSMEKMKYSKKMN